MMKTFLQGRTGQRLRALLAMAIWVLGLLFGLIEMAQPPILFNVNTASGLLWFGILMIGSLLFSFVLLFGIPFYQCAIKLKPPFSRGG